MPVIIDPLRGNWFASVRQLDLISKLLGAAVDGMGLLPSGVRSRILAALPKRWLSSRRFLQPLIEGGLTKEARAAVDEKSVETIRNLGGRFCASGDTERELLCRRWALEIRPTDPAVVGEMARSLLQLGEQDAALAQISVWDRQHRIDFLVRLSEEFATDRKMALSFNCRRAAAHEAQAIACELLTRHERGESRPDDLASLRRLGDLFYRADQAGLAIRCQRIALERAPDDLAVRLDLVRSLMVADREAALAYVNGSELSPERRLTLLRDLGGALARDGRHDLSAFVRRHVADEHPSNAIFQAELKRGLVEAADWPALVREARAALPAAEAGVKVEHRPDAGVSFQRPDPLAQTLTRKLSSNGPASVDIVVVVYGETFTSLFASLTVPNITALVDEIPPDIRARSRVRIFSTVSDIDWMRGTSTLRRLTEQVTVDYVNGIDLASLQRDRVEFGVYGPMIHAQGRAVSEASMAGAALIFHPPDLIFGAGSYRTMLEAAARGKRVVIGPSLRANLEPMRVELLERIAVSPNATLRVANRDLCALIFAHWHKINDLFMWDRPLSAVWKAFAYLPVADRAMLCRFFNGPTFFAWPRKPIPGYTTFIDTTLVLQCCRSARDVWVVDDSDKFLSCDLAPQTRDDNQAIGQQELRGYYLITQLLHPLYMNRLQLSYGLRGCRLHHDDVPEAVWRQGERRLARELNPLIHLGMLLRRARRGWQTLSRLVRAQ